MTATYNTINTSCSFQETEAALIPYSATNQSTISYSASNQLTKEKGSHVPKATDQERDSLLYFLYNMKFGYSQLYLYGLAWLAIFICAPVYVDSNFLIRRVQYRCWVPYCDSDNTTYNASFLEYTIPKNNDTNQFEECTMFALHDPHEDNSTCTSAIFDKKEVRCSKWVYDKELFTSTTVTDVSNEFEDSAHFTPDPSLGSGCWVPYCDSDNTTYNASFLEYTIPKNNDTNQFEECTMFALHDPHEDNSTCTSAIFDKKEVRCSKWVYDKELFTSTTVTDNIRSDTTRKMCWIVRLIAVHEYAENHHNRSVTDKFLKLGMIIQIIRVINEFEYAIGGHTIEEVIEHLEPSVFAQQNLIKDLTAMVKVVDEGLVANPYLETESELVSITTAVEFIGAKWRTFCGIIIEVPFALGEAMTGVLAIFIREWRWLQVAITAPAFLLISYMWIMPESVRWLVSQGRRKEAIEIIEKAAKVNGVEVPRHLLEDQNSEVPTVDGHLSVANSQAELISDDVTDALPKPKKTVIDLLRKPNMRKRSFNMFFCWAVCTLVYYGLSNNSGNLGGNIFVNFILTMLIEIPSYVFSYLVLDRMGRKGTLSFVLLLGGLACFLSGFIPEDIGWLIVTLSLVGKFGIAAAFAIIYVYSAEIFPTEYRSVGIGACSMCARIGGLIAPFVAYTAETYKPLPLLIFGALSIISGMLIVLLPETVGSELPQTLQESEDFGKDQSIWYFSCWHREKEPASATDNPEGPSTEKSGKPEVEGTNI
ncbi:solute carrier family 22 member 21-like [Palaemon carinicauda]|uniref:solute carrier family 22 member 21-like n=1 Tax=Palaemon carinicauda TaxID=392227 RepID=UPI0035B5BCF0